MTTKTTIPPADLHTPEELLDNAETLMATKNPKMMRAAVLEAITALESYVQTVVFSSLGEKLDSLLVRWLEEKTKMDFDSRLSVLTPLAVGHSVDKQSALWAEYKRAKEIRNKVTHSGRKVSPTDARIVIDTVYRWLAYLGSTVKIELALIGLKRYVEEKSLKVTSELEAIRIILDYFGETKASLNAREVAILYGNKTIRPDLILKIGSYTTLVETKFLKANAHSILKNMIQQTTTYLAATGISQGATIIFQQGDLQDVNPSVTQHSVLINGSKKSVIYALVIKV